MFVVLNIAWSKGYIMEFNKKYFPQKKQSEVKSLKSFSLMPYRFINLYLKTLKNHLDISNHLTISCETKPVSVKEIIVM